MAKDRKIPDRIETPTASSKLVAECFNCKAPVPEEARCFGCDEYVCPKCRGRDVTIVHPPESHLAQETTS